MRRDVKGTSGPSSRDETRGEPRKRSNVRRAKRAGDGEAQQRSIGDGYRGAVGPLKKVVGRKEKKRQYQLNSCIPCRAQPPYSCRGCDEMWGEEKMRGSEGTNARVHPDRLVRVDTMMRGFLHATITDNLRSFETHNWAGVDAPSLGVSLLGSELGVDRVQSRLGAR